MLIRDMVLVNSSAPALVYGHGEKTASAVPAHTSNIRLWTWLAANVHEGCEWRIQRLCSKGNLRAIPGLVTQ